MKFLCVKCNEQMLLQEANSHAEINSLSVVYGCGSCGAQTAMLTNPLETQLVKSLGVNIGPDGEQSKKESKCPLTKMDPRRIRVAPFSSEIFSVIILTSDSYVYILM